MHWERFDICEAYAVMEWDWNVGGWLHERPRNQRDMAATSIQLARMQFRPRPNLSWDTLTENGRAIYRGLVERYGFAGAWVENIVADCRRMDGAA